MSENTGPKNDWKYRTQKLLKIQDPKINENTGPKKMTENTGLINDWNIQDPKLLKIQDPKIRKHHLTHVIEFNINVELKVSI